MNRERIITSQLEAQGIELSERLGQHFLVDDQIIDLIASSVMHGGKVIEVGSGIGHVTEEIAEKAGEVVGIEIDTRFQPILQGISDRNPKVRFIMSDALRIDFPSLAKQGEETQVVANLPFHITEPFLAKLVDLPIESAVLLLGDNAAQEIMESENSAYYGKLSLIAQTFFNIRRISGIPKTSFYPQPRTDAVLVELTPKEKEEMQGNPTNFVFAYLIRRAHKYGLVINEMKQALVDVSGLSGKGSLSKKEANRRDRAEVKRQLNQMVLHNGWSENNYSHRNHRARVISQADALERIAKMGVKPNILQKPFFALNNQEIQELVKSVKGILR